MSRQLALGLIAIALLALASTVIVRQALQVENLQARVANLESRIADIAALKLLPVESGK
ncbi:hypothetical protein WG902_16750 [Ramlibacter sp. PS3R-8]|uniref:hypothetical protein n=1 Tax=Ramlibacter sp. PS3R-8 TaxID=3133437 RepID=UPI0030A120C5